jgi:hypothetical protein
MASNVKLLTMEAKEGSILLMRFGITLAATLGLLTVLCFNTSVSAQEHGGVGPHLFANQYTQGYANQATAQMYVSPLPVPAWVGHTYYTYQPLYPHELTYAHTHRYHSYYDNNRGLNRTRVHYSVPPVQTFLNGMYNKISLPRP